MSPQDYQILIDDLMLDEGFRGRPYTDSTGHTTIGYGHNLDAKPLTRRQAVMILEDDLADAIADAQRFPCFAMLDPVRQRVLVQMVFNLGFAKVNLFLHMLAAIARKNFDQAAIEMLSSQWAKQVGARAERLAQQMRTGVA